MSLVQKQLLSNCGIIIIDNCGVYPSENYKRLDEKFKQKIAKTSKTPTKEDIIMNIVHLFLIAKHFQIYEKDTQTNELNLIEDQLISQWPATNLIYKHGKNVLDVTGTKTDKNDNKGLDNRKFTIKFVNQESHQECSIPIILKYIPTEIILTDNETIETISELIEILSNSLVKVFNVDNPLQIGAIVTANVTYVDDLRPPCHSDIYTAHRNDNPLL